MWNLQATLTFSIVESPPLALGFTWSNWSWCVEPQTPPPSSGKLHLPPSRSQTARFTWAGMWSGFAGLGSFLGFAPIPRRLA